MVLVDLLSLSVQGFVVVVVLGVAVCCFCVLTAFDLTALLGYAGVEVFGLTGGTGGGFVGHY
jgi:hypothetical protein